MSFVHGSKTVLYVNGRDVTGNFRKIDTDLKRDSADATVFGLANKAYLRGLNDGTLSAEGLWSGPVTVQDGSLDEYMHTLMGDAGVVYTVFPAGDGAGNVGYGLVGDSTDYKIEEPIDDVGTVALDVQSSVGRERVLSFAPLLTRSAAGQSAAVDNGASSGNGGVAYLHLMALTGTAPTVTVKIEHSADNVTWVDLVTFAVAAAAGAQRVTVAGAVEQYTRASWTLGGTTPGASFWAGFGRF